GYPMRVPVSTRRWGSLGARLGCRFDWYRQGTSTRIWRLDGQRRVDGEHLVRTDESPEEHAHDVHLRSILVEGAAFAGPLGGGEIEGPPRRATGADPRRWRESRSLAEARPIRAVDGVGEHVGYGKPWV